jgi:hypothetical protein
MFKIRLEMRMAPIDKTVIKPYFNASGPESLDKLGRYVLAVRRVGYIKIIVVAVKHTEPVMVLGSKYDVAHTGIPGKLRPGGRIKIYGIKFAGDIFIFAFGNIVVIPDPLAGRGNRINPPMNKQPEPGVAKPPHPLISLNHINIL